MITTTKELRTGDIAVLRNGDRCIFLEQEHSFYPLSHFMSIAGCFFLLSDFKENFKHTLIEQYDIMQVYRKATSFNLKDGTLIYDRPSFSLKDLRTGDIVEFSNFGDLGIVVGNRIVLQGGDSLIIKNEDILSSTSYGRVMRVVRGCPDFNSYDEDCGTVMYEEE